MKAADFRGPTANDFWRRIRTHQADRNVDASSCWLWPGSPSTSGYGRITIQGRSYQTHRIAFCLTHPTVELTSQMHIIHTCNVKLCCRPYHLACADASINMSQAARDGLIPAGERHSRAKLTDVTVVLIIVRWLRGDSASQIASDYGVVPAAVYNILTGKNWKHISQPIVRLLCPDGVLIPRRGSSRRVMLCDGDGAPHAV